MTRRLYQNERATPKGFSFCDACLRDVKMPDLQIIVLPHAVAKRFKLCLDCRQTIVISN